MYTKLDHELFEERLTTRTLKKNKKKNKKTTYQCFFL